MKLVEVFGYRQAVVSGARFPMEHPWIQELRALIPRERQDNHQVAIFEAGEDSWGRSCPFAVLFSDFNAYIGDYGSIRFN